jgi:short-subunit dehydrogenase
MNLEGLTCLVTGASRGIGRAITDELAQRDARVLAAMRHPEPIPGAHPVQLDLGSQDSIDSGLAAITEDVDVLVNNAGQFTAGLLETQELDAIYAMLQVNLLGAIHLTRRLLPGMLQRGRGKIVINSSVVAYANFPAVTTYAASKAGTSGFAEALRRELAPTPVSTLHIVTGGIDTDMLDDTKRQLEPHFPGAERWDQHTPQEWAQKIVKAMEDDDQVLGPGGKAALGKLASHLPRQVLDGVVARGFKR